MNPKLLRLIIAAGGLLIGLGISFGYWQLTLGPDLEVRRLTNESVSWLPITALPDKVWLETDLSGGGGQTAGTRSKTLYYIPKVAYGYTVNDQYYKSEQIRVGAWRTSQKEAAEAILAKYPLGQEVTAYYNPSNPAQSVLEPGIYAGSWIAMGYVIIASGILFALFCLWLAVHGEVLKPKAAKEAGHS